MNRRAFPLRSCWVLLATASAACDGSLADDEERAGARSHGPAPTVAKRADKMEDARRASAPRSDGLCRTDEVPIFQCTVQAGRVAVCGGRTAAAGQRYAEYRFGSAARLELVHRSGEGGAPGAMTWSRHAYSGGGETQIAFARNGFDYVVYSRVVRTGFGPEGRHDPQDQAGVFVKKGGRTISDRRCTEAPGPAASAPWVDEDAAEEFLEEGRFRSWWDD